MELYEEKMSMFGYQNQVLRINLSVRKAIPEKLRMDWARQYIGSKGLAIKYLYEELKPGLNPLSEENKLLLMTGPATGTAVPCSGKLTVASKSPATGTIFDCSMGGYAGIRVKYAGYDAIIFEGKLSEPGYVLICDDKIEFFETPELWGLGAHKTETALTKRYGHEASVLTIGPAGENLIGFSSINTEYYRQAGRGGIGAVMGSKNLKAVVIMGTGGVKIPDIKNGTIRLAEILRKDCATEDNRFVFQTDGTAFVEACSDGGILPKNNFSDTTDENWINGHIFLKKRIGKRGCGSCGLGCGNLVRAENGATCEGPEYETIAVSGPNAGISDADAIILANQVADDMGLDIISAGGAILYAMEMTEKGIHDFGIRFGDHEKYVEYLKLMAKKQGIGADLALGVKGLSEKYGGEGFAMHVKGLEYPQYDPRGSWAMALAYAVCDSGPCHMGAYAPSQEVFAASIPAYTAKSKGRMVYDLAVHNAVKFCICICDMWPLDYERMAEIMGLVTGKCWDIQDVQKVGERVIHLARAFNQREGFNRSHDTVPKRIVNEMLKSGPAAGQKIPQEAFEEMLDEYYEVLGWSQDGIVPESIIKTL